LSTAQFVDRAKPQKSFASRDNKLLCWWLPENGESFIICMSVKIRLKRGGAKNNPSYRIVVADSRSPRDGKFIEELGSYTPTQPAPNYKLNVDRAQYWLKVGAQPSDTVASLIKAAAKAAKV